MPSQTAVMFGFLALKELCSQNVNILQTLNLFSITVKTEIQKSGSQEVYFKSTTWPKLNREGQLKKKKDNFNYFIFKIEKLWSAYLNKFSFKCI